MQPRRPARKPPSKTWFYWFALGMGLLVGSAYLFAAFCGGGSSTVGWTAMPHGHAWFVTAVDDNGPAAAKLSPGDRVLAINGSTRAAEFGPGGDLAGIGAGNTYSVQVQRGGQIQTYSLQIVMTPGLHPEAVVAFLISVLLFALGLWIGLMKPDQLTTRVGFGAFMIAALLFLATSMFWVKPSLGRTALFTYLLINNIWRPFHLALGYDWTSRFPFSVPESKFWRLLRVAVYAIAACCWIPLNLPLVADALYLPSRSALLPAWFPLEAFDRHRYTPLNIFTLTATLAMGSALVRNYRTLPSADARRRMRWAGIGVAAGSVPYGLEVLAKLSLSLVGRADLAKSAFFDWADLFTMSLAGVGPITLAYAIVKHRVLGIRVVIRQGVQYLLAKNVLRLILLSPLLILAIQFALHPGRGMGDVLLHSSWPFYAVLGASAGLSLVYRKQFSTWVDRKFFRNAYQQEEMLLALIDRVRLLTQ